MKLRNSKRSDISYINYHLNQRLICTGYVNNASPGFKFVADEAQAVVWELDMSGNLVKENILNIEGLGQGAKIRKDLTSGYIMTSTAWSDNGG